MNRICILIKKRCKKHIIRHKPLDEKHFRILDFYTNQWIHRDQGYWSKTLTMFFASLVVSVLPFFEPFELEAPNNIPQVLFPLFGIVLGVFSLFFSLSLADRISLIIDKIAIISNKFPRGLRWKDGVNNYQFISMKIAKKLPITMFSLLLVLDIFLILYSLGIF